MGYFINYNNSNCKEMFLESLIKTNLDSTNNLFLEPGARFVFYLI